MQIEQNRSEQQEPDAFASGSLIIALSNGFYVQLLGRFVADGLSRKVCRKASMLRAFELSRDSGGHGFKPD